MSKSNFSEEFKRDAVRQITERGYPVAEVSQRLDVSQHSFFEWKKKFAGIERKGQRRGGGDRAAEEGTGPRHRGARYPKKAAAYFARDAK